MLDKLEILINKFGIQQQTIANGMGVHKSTVNQWYKGTRSPSVENQEKFFAWLDRYRKELTEL